MRVLVISDVHANYHALEAVLADAGQFDVVWSLGDLVGYGPQPNECIERLRGLEHVAIAGNHDWGALGRLDLAEFNVDARQANLWTRDQLSPRSWSFLDTLPETLVEGDFTLAHGSPRHPIWEYLVYASVAALSFAHFTTRTCLVGHSHLPAIFVGPEEEGDACHVALPAEGGPVELGEERYIINPGSVGQPRDGDPRAASLLVDTDRMTIEHRRVPYDVAAVQALMREADLPPRSIARLEYGW